MLKVLKTDFHIHTDFSDGDSSYVQILNKAKKIGLECMAITDHFDKYDKNHEKYGITEEMLVRHFLDIKSYAENIGVKVICGIETCTDFYGNLRLNDRVLKMCDIIITSPHYVEYDNELVPGNYYDGRYWERYKEKVLNMAHGQGDILGHCEGYLPLGGLLIPNTTTYEQRKDICRSVAVKFFDQEYVHRLSSALTKSGKALELHCITQTPRETVIESIAKAGGVFSVGSDAHVLADVGNTSWGAEMLEKYNGQLFLK